MADADVLAGFSGADEVPARFAGVSREAWGQTLDTAAACGLLIGLGAGMYRIHPALPRLLIDVWRTEAGGTFATERAAARDAMTTACAGFGYWLMGEIREGDTGLAFAFIDLQRRTLGTYVAHALTHHCYAEAQDILQPLNWFWDSRGLHAEARGWVTRCRSHLEAPAGTPPSLDTPAGALWLFVVNAEANRAYLAGDLDNAESEQRTIADALTALPEAASQRRLAVVYHQLGAVAGKRGDLGAAEDWYQRSLAIEAAIGNRSGMAASYHRPPATTSSAWWRISAATWSWRRSGIGVPWRLRMFLATNWA